MSECPSRQTIVSDDAEQLAALRAKIAAQDAELAQQAAKLAHSQKIFDRASAAARIGVWECELPSETLTWTDVVYDIFDLPRGVMPERGATLKCYPEESVRELTKRRNKAIEDRTGFTLDAEIISFKGIRRWIRITATVESVDGVPVRIFGMKQDITDEKILADRTRYLAEFDVLTGLANRSQFQTRLSVLDHASSQRPFGALLLIDLDEFKPVNDSLGHAAGDECLKHAAERIRDVCPDAELVARIGGDEFAVLLGPDARLAEASDAARAIIAHLGYPMEYRGHQLKIGASVGIALADNHTPSAQLNIMADAALYAAKKAGRNTFRIHKAGISALTGGLPAGADRLLDNPAASTAAGLSPAFRALTGS
ncbi:diguanylate cyclase domain-containing protein [Tardiphaga sp.]|jgi:diguanylate cyclase (GGDEF)-like protein|uniref:diguanylate cyclase domain-containing protein n=1 Tax=Tardiphaga sp. TaxID=1926292 RepID=UPI0037D9BECA